MQKCNCLVISVDTKKKGNIGKYKNNGQEFSKRQLRLKLMVMMFQIKSLEKLCHTVSITLVKIKDGYQLVLVLIPQSSP